ncbi:MAG: hypothetical protein ACLR6J_12365 [Parabacteroides merdae]
MKKNLMKSAAMGALLLSMAACNGKTSTGEATSVAQRQAKDNAPNSAETTARMNVTTMPTVNS